MHSLNEPRSNLPSIQMKKKKREFSEGKKNILELATFPQLVRRGHTNNVLKVAPVVKPNNFQRKVGMT